MKPCPHCGSQDIEMRGAYYITPRLHCYGCGAHTKVCMSQEEAMKEWDEGNVKKENIKE